MPIYAYRCDRCGFQQDVLRKMSDPLLVTCPSCGEDTFRKQVTAAGFQLKGSGWYVTDFRNPATKDGAKPSSSEGDAAPKGDAPAESASATPPESAKPVAAPDAKPASPAPKAGSPPAGSDG